MLIKTAWTRHGQGKKRTHVEIREEENVSVDTKQKRTEASD